MSQPKVLITRGYAPEVLREFCDEFDVAVGATGRYLDRWELLERVGEVDALISRSADRVDREVMERAPRLRVVSNFGVGFETLDVEEATRRGIWVCNTPDVLTEATADLAIALLLCACRRISEAEAYVRNGQWNQINPDLFHGSDPEGKVLGILGMGRIGQALARRARAFGMRLIYHNRRRVAAAVEEALGARFVPLEELWALSDFLSVHTPLTPETEHLIDRPQFARMKPGVYFVNTSRGKVVREAALVEALASGKVRGAGLDVFENEPAVHPDLLRMPNVTLLPHIGSATRETRRRMEELTLDNARRVLRGERPRTPVNDLGPAGTRRPGGVS
ncbi:MAG: D-glycerate dehydrogenase [Planctomycetes bacterium]|nr:D-glycerate dehydrogenase [Planctomycetota bacterium]